MKTTFGERLITLINEKGIKNNELAKIIEVSNGTITNWTKDSSKPDGESLIKLSDYFNKSVRWLVLGEDEHQSDDIYFGSLNTWDENSPLDEDEVPISYYKEVKVAGGKGASQVKEFTDGKLRFSLKTLKKHGVKTDNAVCWVVTGDSMANEIKDGDVIGIDKGRREIKDGRIYAVNHKGLLRVKYLHKTPEGIRLRSHNEDKTAYPDEIILNENIDDDLEVLGWVFWKSTNYTW